MSQLTCDTLQPDLETCHKFLERTSKSIDFVSLSKESIHKKLMTMSKVIIICAGS